MRMTQFELLQAGDGQRLNQHREQVATVCLQLSMALQNVPLVMDKYLLEPIELYQVQFLLQQFRIFHAHAEALNNELMW